MTESSSVISCEIAFWTSPRFASEAALFARASDFCMSKRACMMLARSSTVKSIPGFCACAMIAFPLSGCAQIAHMKYSTTVFNMWTFTSCNKYSALSFMK